MSYYFLYQKKGIPSFLAYFILLFVTVGLGFFLYQNTGSYKPRASKYVKPQQIKVANVSNESVVIYFLTKEKVPTFIRYGTNDQIEAVVLDDRDKGEAVARQIHYFSLNQLKPNTEYAFKIFISGREYENQAQPYQFRTLSITEPKTTQAPIFGKILNQKLEPINEVLIIAQLTNSKYTFASLNRSTGEWIIAFPIVVDSLLHEYKLNDSDLIELTVIGPDLVQSKVKVRYKDSQPVKTTVLGNDYDLTKSGQTLGVNKSQDSNSLVTSPRQNAIISSQYPVFRGVVTPQALVQLALEPALFSTSVTATGDGEWSYTTQKPLPPGKYQLTVIDRSNQSKSTLAFQIAKSGETVLGEATPSATVVPEPTAFPSPTLIPTASPAPSPSPTGIIPAGLNNNLLILVASGLSLFGLFLLLY